MITPGQMISSVLAVGASALFFGRIRHMFRRKSYAEQLGGKYDAISGRIFIQQSDRLIEFTAVEKGNAYVPRPTIACSLKTTAQCDVVPVSANPTRAMTAETMPSKEVRINGAAYLLKAESAERLSRLESLIRNASFSLLFSSPASMPRLQIYPLSTVARGVEDLNESHILLTDLPHSLVTDAG